MGGGACRQHPVHGSKYLAGVGANHRVGAMAHRYRPFGILPQGQTRDTQRRGLFLHPAGIGQDQSGIGHQTEKIQVTYRSTEPQALGQLETPRLQPCLRAWMGRKQDRQAFVDAAEQVEEACSFSGSSTLLGRCSVTRA